MLQMDFNEKEKWSFFFLSPNMVKRDKKAFLKSQLIFDQLIPIYNDLGFIWNDICKIFHFNHIWKVYFLLTKKWKLSFHLRFTVILSSGTSFSQWHNMRKMICEWFRNLKNSQKNSLKINDKEIYNFNKKLEPSYYNMENSR